VSSVNRDVREVIRDEHLMRRRVLAALESGPLTIPEIAEAVSCPPHEVMFWVMGMRKYGHVVELREANDEGFYLYQAVEREEA
jgi:predicted Rossmann fold nucleotide-binding protein DprA/Smf involved in DNA uptake